MTRFLQLLVYAPVILLGAYGFGVFLRGACAGLLMPMVFGLVLLLIVRAVAKAMMRHWEK